MVQCEGVMQDRGRGCGCESTFLIQTSEYFSVSNMAINVVQHLIQPWW